MYAAHRLICGFRNAPTLLRPGGTFETFYRERIMAEYKDRTEKISTLLQHVFPASSYEEWREAAVKLLKGAPFEKKMLADTYEGITLQPMYWLEDVKALAHAGTFPGFAPYARGNTVAGYKTAGWKVAQEIRVRTPDECHAALRHDLQHGQTAINLVLDRAAQDGLDPERARAEQVGKGGVSISTADDLETVLEEVDVGELSCIIQAGTSSVTIAAFAAAIFQQRGIPLQQLQGCIGLDPLGILATRGTLPHSLETAYTKMASLTKWTNNVAPQLRTILVQGTPYHHGGASVVQELAYILATAVEYLRHLLDAGLTVDQIAPHVQITCAIGTHCFMEIAKLRAVRILWAKAIKAFHGNEASQKAAVHVQSTLWNKTIHDPYVNMLRTTVEAFAGVVGGCESLHVGGFDDVVRTPDDFSRRIARNIQIILKEEAHIHEVTDPAGGAWYVEKLTDEVARKAWALFQEIERRGGMAKALHDGIIQEQISHIAKKRTANLSTRKQVIVGTNMYPNLQEQPLEPSIFDDEAFQKTRREMVGEYRASRNAVTCSSAIEQIQRMFRENPLTVMDTVINAAATGLTLGEIEGALRFGEERTEHITPVKQFRGAEMFERLRAATEQYTVTTGQRPTVFLANMGPVSQHKARAEFSTGFFEVGGFEVLRNNGFLSIEEAAGAARDSEASVVVICSTDATYPDIVPPLTQNIKAESPDTIVVVAGYPKNEVERFKKAGVDEFIHLKANVHTILTEIMTRLNIL